MKGSAAVFFASIVLAGCGGGGGGSEGSPGEAEFRIANSVPVADAGASRSVVVGSQVSLDASASRDADGDPLAYEWTLTSRPNGSAAALSNADTAAPSFTADVEGLYVLSLLVGDGRSTSAAVTVTVLSSSGNAAPVADAGQAAQVTVGSTVTLDGGASSDANGDVLAYTWSFISRPPGSAAAVNTASAVRPTFLADREGTYVVSLVVSDGSGGSGESTVTITAVPANAAPVATVGAPQHAVAGSVVALDGSASSDANGDALSYAWTFASRPTGSNAQLTGAGTQSPSFTPDVPGTFVVSLVVNDGAVDSKPSSVAIAVSAPVPQPLPVGAGTFAQHFPFGPFYAINEGNGVLTAQAPGCRGFSAADVDPNGRVLAVGPTSAIVFDVDIHTGLCAERFAAPEPMQAIAVAPDGAVVTISAEKYFGRARLYRFSPAGAVLGQVSLFGTSGLTGIGDLTSSNGIDFGPDGVLYALGLASMWEIDPTSGAAVLRAVSPAFGSGDIDIDSSGVLRSIDFGELTRHQIAGWSLIDSRVLEQNHFGFSPLLRR